MEREKFIEFAEDVSEIAKYLNWRSEPGYEHAQKIINEIHAGKYGSSEGIWPQFSKAIEQAKLDKNKEKGSKNE